MSEPVNRFLGDSPGRTVVKLVVVSLMVGFAMSASGLYPMDILIWTKDFIVELWRNGFAALGSIGDYLLLGGVVVIPVFIVIRLLSFRKS